MYVPEESFRTFNRALTLNLHKSIQRHKENKNWIFKLKCAPDVKFLSVKKRYMYILHAPLGHIHAHAVHAIAVHAHVVHAHAMIFLD